MAQITKNDLKNAVKFLATKNDLKNFATKDDLENFVTKEDLNNVVKNLATKTELDNFVTKDDLKKAIKYLPTKTEFYDANDKIMGELQAVREEITILSDMKRQVNDHEDRLETVEEKIGIPLAA